MFWYLSQTKSSAKITIPLLRVRWLNLLPLPYVSPLKIHVAPSVREILMILLLPFSPNALPYQNESELDRISSMLLSDLVGSPTPTSNDPIILTFSPLIYTLLVYFFCHSENVHVNGCFAVMAVLLFPFSDPAMDAIYTDASSVKVKEELPLA